MAMIKLLKLSYLLLIIIEILTYLVIFLLGIGKI